MSDRELLALAAKAAGMVINKKRQDERDANGYQHDGLWTNTTTSWTPLHDSGDALELAVKLQIDIKHYGDHVVCWYESYLGTGRVMYGADRSAATRRAIVLAAAEIGKEMK